MGSAAHTSGDQVRFGLAATGAAAVLYGAVVAFGLGPAPPSPPGRSDDRSASVVRLAPHDPAASGPVQRGPQPSAGPARQSSPRTRPAANAERARSPRGTKVAPERPADGPRTPVSIPNAPLPPSPSPSQQPLQLQPAVADTTLPEVTAPTPRPEVPELNAPTLALPPLPLPPPSSLPEAPSVSTLP